MNEILRVRSYRSSFTNEFVHASFMFDSFMNDFYRFHFYRSFSDERTKRPAFFRSCSMFVHLWTNDRSFVLAVEISDSNSVENRKNRKTLGRSEIFLKSDSDFREIRRA